jgi:hypothetical protein
MPNIACKAYLLVDNPVDNCYSLCITLWITTVLTGYLRARRALARVPASNSAVVGYQQAARPARTTDYHTMASVTYVAVVYALLLDVLDVVVISC